MTFTVQLFAGFAELSGPTVSLDLPGPATVREIRRALKALWPDRAEDLEHSLIAVNQAYAAEDQEVSETDEIALIPPVGGGSTEDFGSILITEDPLDVGQAYQELVDARCGGIVLFTGTVREWTSGRQTVYLEYEAYRDMAIRQMQAIARDVCRQWPGTLPLQWHRVGRLYPTDIAVICAAAAPHRQTAFDAARTLIERLKKEVPIWKKEIYADGDAVWQANRP
ncbi:molybdenum cofactor biosynthesis protein MoaE [Alicyclobacillus sp.]|uniref:molybdenum cofactor biosynthesis protein n=1 Tax=Alicyclobacillus sp. TaxID=61169 RepID=UPI0025C7243B|nr:molybdenum cofactor biosynthesis protein MoaE [Alicyclobacillus sp.]MCL6515796.1 molybdenum cofactor biosynthesis protein MoaE [Alicyclobacillus sp.]